MDIKFVFFSLIGNTRRLVNKFAYENFEIHDGNADIKVDFKFVLFVPTYEKDVTYVADDFLEINAENCLGIVGCGNLNFNDLYCFTAKNLSSQFNIPIIRLVEYSGSHIDVEYIKGAVEEIGKTKRS